MDNPATLSSALAGLFPPGVVAAELREAGNPELLLPAEARHIGRAVPKRVREFAAGRLCARRALAEFGVVDFAVEMAANRQPIWPDALVGSISHTAGFCASVVAERRLVGSVGLDSEGVGNVNVEIWSRICAPVESEWVRALPPLQQAAAVTLIFAAKEAFYKCQYPVVQERLDFQDVRVEAAWGAQEGRFTLHATRRIAVCQRAAMPLQGRYLIERDILTAGMSLVAAAHVQ